MESVNQIVKISILNHFVCVFLPFLLGCTFWKGGERGEVGLKALVIGSLGCCWSGDGFTGDVRLG
jgi:hypothetical protein